MGGVLTRCPSNRSCKTESKDQPTVECLNEHLPFLAQRLPRPRMPFIYSTALMIIFPGTAWMSCTFKRTENSFPVTYKNEIKLYNTLFHLFCDIFLWLPLLTD